MNYSEGSFADSALGTTAPSAGRGVPEGGGNAVSRESYQDPVAEALIGRAQQGDVQAFEGLYRLHVGWIYGLCLRLVGDAVQAESLTQDVFVRAWEKLGSYAGRGVFAGWLRRLAVNVVMEDRRAAARRARWMMPLPDTMETGWNMRGGAVTGTGKIAGSDMTVAPAATEDAIDLDRAIMNLPIGARLTFVLHDVMGYPHKEIAEMTGSAVGTVKAQLHRARRLLRQALDETLDHTPQRGSDRGRDDESGTAGRGRKATEK